MGFGGFAPVKIEEIIEEYSGKKTNKFSVSSQSVALIDRYIIERQTNVLTGEALQTAYDALRQEIVKIENSATKTERLSHDIDLLFRRKGGQYIYTEIKYNDDHDTDKFIGINRKVLLTYALLVHELHITDIDSLVPCLMYFNNKTMKGNFNACATTLGGCEATISTCPSSPPSIAASVSSKLSQPWIMTR